MADRLYRQFMWGLANGVIVLAIAGAFFIGAGAASLEDGRGQSLGLAFALVGLALLVLGARRVRRNSAAFSLADLGSGTESERQLGRRLSLAFRWVILAEWTGFGLVSFLCHHFHADELTAPLIGLIISLHFAPLALIFRLPGYYLTALFGSGFAVLSIVYAAERLPVLGFGLGSVMWLTAVHSVMRADHLATRWAAGPHSAARPSS